MYNKRVLSQDQCQAAIAAVNAAFKKLPGDNRWTMAIVDDAGNLFGFHSLGRSRPHARTQLHKKGIHLSYVRFQYSSVWGA